MGHPPRDGVPPSPRLGYPPCPRLGYPPPIQGWIGVPPYPRLDQDTPPPPSKAGSGTPPPRQGWIGMGYPPKSWTDTHLWKHNLPSYVRTRAVKRTRISLDKNVGEGVLRDSSRIKMLFVFNHGRKEYTMWHVLINRNDAFLCSNQFFLSSFTCMTGPNHEPAFSLWNWLERGKTGGCSLNSL